jgi:hypothetical protein
MEVDMRDRCLGSLGTLAVVATVASLTAVSVGGQAGTASTKEKKPATTKPWIPPRTADGQPDFQGIWMNNSATPLERPQALEGRQFLTDEEVSELSKRAARFRQNDSDAAVGDNLFLAALANVGQYKNPNATGGAGGVERDFDNRTSLIVDPPDGKIPFTPEGQRKQAAAAQAREHPAPVGPEDLPNDLRCLTFGIPRLGGNAAGYNSYYQIVQTRGSVVLFGEVIHDARVISLDGRPHLPSSVRLWQGDARGRWEGGTLVVDTTNFSPKSYFLGSTENLHLVERFTRVAENTIDNEVTVSDPGVWKQPWTAVIHLKQAEDRMYEYACHEGNYQTMTDMLAGASAAEKAAAEAARAQK